jgi:hypothetical protein
MVNHFRAIAYASSAPGTRPTTQASRPYRRGATVVGIHSDGDVNRKRTTFARDIIRQAHRYTATRVSG